MFLRNLGADPLQPPPSRSYARNAADAPASSTNRALSDTHPLGVLLRCGPRRVSLLRNGLQVAPQRRVPMAEAAKVPYSLHLHQRHDTIRYMGRASRLKAERRARRTAPKPTIRTMAAKDLATATTLLQGVVENSKGLETYLPDGPLRENQFCVGLVAEQEGKVLGVIAGKGVMLSLDNLPVSQEEVVRRVALLDLLAVHPDHHGLGFGTLLHNAMVERFRTSGHRVMMANLASGRRDLLPIYRKWGWNVGEQGAGIAIEIGTGPIALAEDAATRVAWQALSPEVRAVLYDGFKPPVVTGVFE